MLVVNYVRVLLPIDLFGEHGHYCASFLTFSDAIVCLDAYSISFITAVIFPISDRSCANRMTCFSFWIVSLFICSVISFISDRNSSMSLSMLRSTALTARIHHRTWKQIEKAFRKTISYVFVIKLLTRAIGFPQNTNFSKLTQ